jgi:hypothetical protein
MNNPFENKAIKFATEQELNHLAELARGYGLYNKFPNNGHLPEITYSDFIASLQPTEQQPDMVNHPPHYTVNGIEVIDVIENYKLNYRLGNVVKYVLRSDLKGNRLQDLKKALWYLQREIDKTETI